MSKPKFTMKILKDLNASSFSAMKYRVAELGSAEIKVGLPDDKKHEGGPDDGTPLVLIGAVHEFGSEDRGIPERSFLRTGVRSQQDDMIRLNRINLVKVIRGMMPVSVALRQLGAFAQRSVQLMIRNGKFVPLKQATIDRKGSSKPLIDKGQMVQAVTFTVEQKGGK